MVVMTGNVLKVRGLFQDSYIIVTGLTYNRFYPMIALSIYYTSGELRRIKDRDTGDDACYDKVQKCIDEYLHKMERLTAMSNNR